jgi:hypothetical protein
MVEVHHDEGVTSRIDPESCAVAREGNSEALTGERIGQPLSRESTLIPGADVVLLTECKRLGTISQAPRRSGVRSLRGNREISRSGPPGFAKLLTSSDGHGKHCKLTPSERAIKRLGDQVDTELKGELKAFGGSRSDDLNEVLMAQVLGSLPRANGEEREHA